MADGDDPGADEFARAIRTRRESLRLKQQELAELAGVSERFVYAMEKGKTTARLDKVLPVLAALGLHLELRRGPADTIRPSAELMR